MGRTVSPCVNPDFSVQNEWERLCGRAVREKRSEVELKESIFDKIKKTYSVWLRKIVRKACVWETKIVKKRDIHREIETETPKD